MIANRHVEEALSIYSFIIISMNYSMLRYCRNLIVRSYYKLVANLTLSAQLETENNLQIISFFIKFHSIVIDSIVCGPKKFTFSCRTSKWQKIFIGVSWVFPNCYEKNIQNNFFFRRYLSYINNNFIRSLDNWIPKTYLVKKFLGKFFKNSGEMFFVKSNFSYIIEGKKCPRWKFGFEGSEIFEINLSLGSVRFCLENGSEETEITS